MKNLLIAAVLLCFSSIAAADSYGNYVEKLVKYNACANSSFSGGPACVEPAVYDPCRTSMSGGPPCKSVKINSCGAVYSTETQSLYIVGGYILDGKTVTPVPYARFQYWPDYDNFTLEEYIE